MTRFPAEAPGHFEVYLDGFSPNVQDILENFEFRNQIPRLSKADALGGLIEKFLDKDVNLNPRAVGDLPGLDNHSMGTMFEELVRRFNEDNNEETGEHWTPRDAVRLMANMMFLPVADRIESGTYLLYDCACVTGGMLTVAEETLQQVAADHGKKVATHLYGQEINAETYAICKADLLLKGDRDAADNIVGGPEHSTLANDAFRSQEFDFMLANPPYGKSWKSDLERTGGKKDLRDPRFIIEHDGESNYSLVTRSSDGQMMFLANMLSKMKHDTPFGSRIAEVHNGSSLFTGDAGQGESNIRRWIIESDWLEAIVALPLNMSHFTTILTQIRDVDALEAACAELGVEMLRDTEARGFTNSTRHGELVVRLKVPYDIAANRPTPTEPYELSTDWWNGHVEREVGPNYGRLLQLYGVHKTMREASKEAPPRHTSSGGLPAGLNWLHVSTAPTSPAKPEVLRSPPVLTVKNPCCHRLNRRF